MPAPVVPEPTPELLHEEPSSPLRLALVVMGFLAATILVVVALLHASGGSGSELSPEEDAARLGLPALVGSPHDADFATILGSGPDSPASIPDPAPLLQGGTLLVFARPSGPVGIDTAELGVETHKRLRQRDLQVVLVLPRESVAVRGVAGHDANGTPDGAAVREALRTLGVSSDVRVVLDPPDERGPGRLRRGLFHVPEDAAAVLLEDGVEVMRVVPPSPAIALARVHLAPLIHAAISRHAIKAVAPAPGADDDPGEPAEPAAPPATDPGPK